MTEAVERRSGEIGDSYFRDLDSSPEFAIFAPGKSRLRARLSPWGAMSTSRALLPRGCLHRSPNQEVNH